MAFPREQLFILTAVLAAAAAFWLAPDRAIMPLRILAD